MIENAKDTDYYKTLKNILGGVEPSVELFAKHVTHGITETGILADLAGDGSGTGIRGYERSKSETYYKNDNDGWYWEYLLRPMRSEMIHSR